MIDAKLEVIFSNLKLAFNQILAPGIHRWTDLLTERMSHLSSMNCEVEQHLKVFDISRYFDLNEMTPLVRRRSRLSNLKIEIYSEVQLVVQNTVKLVKKSQHGTQCETKGLEPALIGFCGAGDAPPPVYIAAPSSYQVQDISLRKTMTSCQNALVLLSSEVY